MQLLASDTLMTTPTAHILLSLGMMLELLGILLAFSSPSDDHTGGRHHLSLLLWMPKALVVLGIISLGVAIILETSKASLSTAVVMACMLFFEILLYILGFIKRTSGVEDEVGRCVHAYGHL